MPSEREVKKGNRELALGLEKYDSNAARMEFISKQYAVMLREVKKLQHESGSFKKKHDQMQKERDVAKAELSKIVSLKDKLEKLSREQSTENRKLRVCCRCLMHNANCFTG
jgi:hypothetical protein